MVKLYIKIKVVNKNNQLKELIKRADNLKYISCYFPTKSEIIKQMERNVLRIKSGNYKGEDLIFKKYISSKNFSTLLNDMAKDGMLSIPKNMKELKIFSNLNDPPIFIIKRSNINI